MNSMQITEVLDNCNVEVEVSVACQECNCTLEGRGQSREQASVDLLVSIDNEKWNIGLFESEAYQTEYTILCDVCLYEMNTQENNY